MPRSLIRRHEPRVSPSWTCAFGPTDATTCALRDASVRTITQCLATIRSHDDDDRRLRGNTVDVTRGGVETSPIAAVVGALVPSIAPAVSVSAGELTRASVSASAAVLIVG